MCGRSNVKIKGEEAELFMGYRGSTLTIGDVVLSNRHLEKDENKDSSIMWEKLMGYSKEDLVNLMMEIVKYGGEG